MKIAIEEFFGARPKRDPKLLDPRQAQVADNTKLWSGKLAAWRAAAEVYTPLGDTPVLSIYHHADAYWFESDKDVDWVRGPVNDDGGFVYATDGIGYAQITTTDLATTGEGAYPRGSHRLGVPTPTTAPGVVVNPITGSISAITANPITSEGTDIAATVTVEGKAFITCRASGIFEAAPYSKGYLALRIFADGVKIAEERRTLFVGPIEPPRVPFDVEAQVTHTPDSDGEVTYSFSLTPVNFGDPITYGYHQGPDFESAVRQSGTLTVTLNAGHGLNAGDRIRINGAGGMGDLNDEEFTIIAVDGNDVLIASTSESTYTGGGTWTKIWSATETESRAYVFTYIADLDGLVMEGAPSPPSAVIDAANEQGVTVSFPAAPDAAWNVTGVRLYRTATDSNGNTEFLFLTELEGGKPGNYSDDSDGDDLGEAISTEAFIPPPFALKGLTNLDNGVMVGFSGNTLYPCEPYQPHAFPTEYQKTTTHPIVALVAIGGSTHAVLTTGFPEILSGRHPADFAKERIDTSLACLSKRAAVDMGYAAVYPSDVGLVALSVGRADVATRELFTRDEWQALNPASMLAARYDDRYVCFYETTAGVKGGFVFDPREPGSSLVFLDYHATAAWTDPRNGSLYLVVNDKIVQFDGGEDLQTYTWRSKRFVLPYPITPSFAQVKASSYPVTLECFGKFDGALISLWEATVADDRPFRVPGGELCDEFELELRGSATVEAVTLADSIDEIRAAG